MYKKIGFGIIIVLISIGLFFLFTKKEKEIIIDKTIFDTDLEKYYPKTPEDIIKINNDIIKILYSEELTENEIIELVKKQRILFSEELKKENSEENHTNTVLKEISEFKITNNKIVDFQIGVVTYDKYSDNISMVNVKEILESGDSFSLRYYIISENDYYKILAWEYI